MLVVVLRVQNTFLLGMGAFSSDVVRRRNILAVVAFDHRATWARRSSIRLDRSFFALRMYAAALIAPGADAFQEVVARFLVAVFVLLAFPFGECGEH